MRLAAAAQQSGDFTYTTTGGIITITGYSGAGGAVTIPGAINGLPVAAIGGGAFARCSSLTSVTIPSGVTNIGNGDVTGLGFNDYLAVFSGCVTLEAITVDTLNPVYSSLDGVLFDKGQSTLIAYPPAKAGGYSIPSGVTSIDWAFCQCYNLTNVNIPSSVTSLNGPFYECPALASVTIPGSVTNVCEAFYSCANLTTIVFLGNAPYVNSLGGYRVGAFWWDPATAYYLPGTTGWGATLGPGLPTCTAPPSITGQPQSVTSQGGTAVSFRVSASGVPLLGYGWCKSSASLPWATNISLTISNVQPADAGGYTVVVTNLYGAATSQVATLTVLVPLAATATATADVVNGFLVGASVTDEGCGYTNTPPVRIIGGGGSGAQAVAVVTNGVVVAVDVLAAGVGYTNAPVIIIEPPFISQPTMTAMALTFGPLVTPVIELSLGNLAPYDNYQIQFAPVAGGTWTNLGNPFTPTAAMDTEYVNTMGNLGFLRVKYVP